MQISQALSTLMPSTSSPVSFSNALRPLPASRVEDIFTRLTAQLGKKIEDLFGAVPQEDIKAEWADGLAGYRGREIMRGLKACQARVFAPTLGEFCLLCRPTLDPEVAWLEAAEGVRARRNGNLGEWSHPAVYRASLAMPYELASYSYRACRKQWDWTLSKEFSKGWGEDVPPPPLRLARPDPVAGPPNQAVRDHIAKLLRPKSIAQDS